METSPEDFFVHAHLREPPKALSDALEAIVGAIFIDCGHKLEVVFNALENIYLELLPLLKAEPPLDPVSDLLTWARKEGCGKVLLK
jgi:endoribonuclease Dicer